ncbi:MAG: hypothetical protein PHD31_00620 [Candidatus Pacebacteria bacterium]|nr:hypothetical protein [Candidatus Paceibacterota bacterium]
MLFKTIKNVVEKIEIDLGTELLSCHVLARAITKIIPTLKCEDGYYYPNYCHSWLKTPSGHLIDVYPVASIGGPILIVNHNGSPIHFLYIKRPTKEIVDISKNSFKISVKKTENILKEHFKEYLTVPLK